MRRATFALLTFAVLLGGLIAAPAASARVRVVDHFCSESGDYCLYVLRVHGRIKFEFREFPFRGDYKLCVKPPRHPVDCDHFFLHRQGPIFISRVDFARHFPHSYSGRYRVGWTVDGFHLHSLHFRKH